ncbi:MAG: ATP-binding protein [Alphaproteobacteria bacterium]
MTYTLANVIAFAALALAVTGFAAWALFAARLARRSAAAAAEARATLATAPAGWIAWDEAGAARASPDLATRLSAWGAAPSPDDEPLARLNALLPPTTVAAVAGRVQALRAFGEDFSITALTADGARALRLDGRRAADAPLDVLWIADVTSETAIQSDTAIQLTAAEVERDGLRAMVDALPFAMWRRGGDLRIAQANRAFVGTVEDGGTDAGALEDRYGLELAQLARATGRPQSESRNVVVAGERRLYEFHEVPTDDGEVAGYALDVTQLEGVQQELASHIAAQAEVLENVYAAIAIYGADTRLKFYNSAYARLWDADSAWLDSEPTLGEELESLHDRRRLTEQVDFRAWKAEQQRLFGSLIAPLEELIHLPDGRTLRRRTTAHPFGGLMMVYEDVTDSLTLERRYNTLIEVQRRTLDNLYEGIALIGADGRLKLCNSAYARLWQFSERDLQGEPHIAELTAKQRHFWPDDADWPALAASIVDTVTSREPVSGRVERIDGSVLEFTGVPLPDGMKLVSYLDVSDRHRVERALRERNEALEAADQLKSEFVANVSYELRTPLNTIIGFAEVLSGNMFGPLNERQAEYVDGILESSETLLELINDILDLASIEAGYFELETAPVDVKAMMTGVFALNRERARSHDLELALDCPDDIGTIVADERRLKQVLFNLVSNAIKFTPAGGRIELRADRDGAGMAFAVSDTGIGIPEEEHSRVLRKFERGRNPFGRQTGTGAGLGLSLVKSIVELHGGGLDIRSAVDQGTTVTCRIPPDPDAAMRATADPA